MGRVSNLPITLHHQVGLLQRVALVRISCALISVYMATAYYVTVAHAQAETVYLKYAAIANLAHARTPWTTIDVRYAIAEVAVRAT